MNWLDRAIEWVSPETAYERKAYRRALEQERNYDAAGFDRVNSNWRVINESAEMTDRYGRDVVRARARDLERNSDIMGAVIGAYKRNVFGRGYRLRASSGDEKLNTRIEELWEIWCKKKNCDVTGTQSFNAMMRMAVRRKKIDGGIILLKRYTAGGLVPFKLQAIEVDELDTNSMRPHKKETGWSEALSIIHTTGRSDTGLSSTASMEWTLRTQLLSRKKRLYFSLQKIGRHKFGKCQT